MRTSVLVLAAILVSMLPVAAQQTEGPVAKVVLHHTLAQGFQIQNSNSGGKSYTMVVNGAAHLLLERNTSDPAPTITFVENDDAEMHVNWIPGVPPCCAVYGQRFINTVDKECNTICSDCQCMHCFGCGGGSPTINEFHIGPGATDLDRL